ncbi:MAG: MGMT family protein [Solirubrobacteraceae bacterium]
MTAGTEGPAGGRASTRRPPQDDRRARILDAVRAIPEGYVRTYGDIDPAAPRLVGRVLHDAGHGVPWHRVVRADGSLAQGARQRELLRGEAVPMRGERVDLAEARLPLPPGEHLSGA